MQFKRLKKFILYHWLPGIPFAALMISGGVILFSRFWNIDVSSFQAVVRFHKITALVWAVLLLLTLAIVGSNLHFASIKALVTWGRDDLEWLKFSFKCLLNPNLEIPNPRILKTRQKVNNLLVAFSILGFFGSGFILWRYNTVLIAWYIHAILFFMSIALVGGHAYLSFIRSSRQVPVGAFIKAEMFFFLLIILFGLVGFLVFNEGRRASMAKDFIHFVRPSELSSKHRGKEIGDDCSKCHEYTGELKNEKCLACHKIIQQRMEKKIGFHGTFKGLCRYCHREHPAISGSIVPFDEKKFDHDLSVFKRRGKHLKPKCDECHIRKIKENGGVYYMGTKYELCVYCHKDPHLGELGQKCELCHNDFGWTGKDVNYLHNRDSKYHLEGKHLTTECKKCHAPRPANGPLGSALFRGNKSECLACHKDPHYKNELGNQCQKCHNAFSWLGKDVSFDHNRDSKYRLDGKHLTTECKKCHAPRPANGVLGSAQFRGLKTDCASCHKDPHYKNELGVQCETCHNIVSWLGKEVSFDHNRDSKYRLEGKHLTVECKKCHVPESEKAPLGSARFRGLKTYCLACHKDPHYQNELGLKCEICHNIVSWLGKEVNFSHNRDSKYLLDGKHLTIECKKCHIPATEKASLGSARFRDYKTDCPACHKEPHRTEYQFLCLACHTTAKWPKPEKEVAFDHKRDSKYPLTGKHVTAKCFICHNQLVVSALGAEKLKGFASNCTVCHTDPHKKALGPDCLKCHSAEGWAGKNLLFNHELHSTYPLGALHQRVPCVACHKENHYKPIEADCQSETCHPSKKPPWEYDRGRK